MDKNEDIRVVPETQPGFEGSATIEGVAKKSCHERHLHHLGFTKPPGRVTFGHVGTVG